MTSILFGVQSYANSIYQRADNGTNHNSGPLNVHVVDDTKLEKALAYETSDHIVLRSRAIAELDNINLLLTAAKIIILAAYVINICVQNSAVTTVLTTIPAILAWTCLNHVQIKVNATFQIFSHISLMNDFYAKIVKAAKNEQDVFDLVAKEFSSNYVRM